MASSNNKSMNSLQMSQEEKLKQLYGGLPPRKKSLLSVTKERRFFDSGDYALAKAGKGTHHEVGKEVASPESIPHTTCYSPTGSSPPRVSPIAMAAPPPPRMNKPSSLGTSPPSFVFNTEATAVAGARG